MSFTIVLALGSMIAVAISDLVYKMVQRKSITSSSFMPYQFLSFSALVLAVWGVKVLLGGSESVVAGTWQYGLPSGIGAFVAMLLFLQSLRDGDASVNAPIFRLNFVVTVMAAFAFLGESLTVWKSVGILLAILSVLCLASPAILRKGVGNRRAFSLVLAGALLFGIVGVLSKRAIDLGSSTIALAAIQSVGFGSVAIMYAISKGAMRPSRVILRYAPVVGFLQLVFILLLFESLRRGDASVTYPITQLSFVLTAVLAVLLLKETASVSKFAGLCFAIAAVVALAL
ncbi:MAG: DMT family transporter [Chloroflexi bacterium]|nr:DMT family transporter [Chloroflexota bacterium]